MLRFLKKYCWWFLLFSGLLTSPVWGQDSVVVDRESLVSTKQDIRSIRYYIQELEHSANRADYILKESLDTLLLEVKLLDLRMMDKFSQMEGQLGKFQENSQDLGALQQRQILRLELIMISFAFVFLVVFLIFYFFMRKYFRQQKEVMLQLFDNNLIETRELTDDLESLIVSKNKKVIQKIKEGLTRNKKKKKKKN